MKFPPWKWSINFKHSWRRKGWPEGLSEEQSHWKLWGGRTHCLKSPFIVQKFNFDKNPNIFTSFSPQIFFWQFFSWNQSCQQLKSPKPQHFHEFFTPKKSTIFSGNQSWIFGQKMKISNSVKKSGKSSWNFVYIFKLHIHTVRNLHFLSKNSTLISRENCRFFWLENLVNMLSKSSNWPWMSPHMVNLRSSGTCK